MLPIKTPDCQETEEAPKRKTRERQIERIGRGFSGSLQDHGLADTYDVWISSTVTCQAKPAIHNTLCSYYIWAPGLHRIMTLSRSTTVLFSNDSQTYNCSSCCQLPVCRIYLHQPKPELLRTVPRDVCIISSCINGPAYIVDVFSASSVWVDGPSLPN